ncbi:MAG: NAD-dependent succinate-semialdehyde dehydrogenase [Gammaproteobacteria bacterium]|nr:NAD-dependent succinate-semialdehyde dehydrogenase [Gammaproteobacteria bacterium]
MLINGQWLTGGASFAVTDPATGEHLGDVQDGGAAETTAAVDAAQAAFPAWAGQTAFARADILRRAYDLMVERKAELARLLSREQGKPLRAATVETQYAADFLLWFSEQAKRVYGDILPSPRADQRFLVLRQPVGVVGAITPWNYPISMLTRKLGPALAAGCTVVLKPAEATPLIAIEVFKLLQEAGVPDGVINLVTASDPKPVGEVLVSDPRVRKITFTGSTAVGKLLARGAGEHMKRISLELGGHAPFIVYKDADPIHAAKGAAAVKFLNTGQACISPNRMYVHESQVEPFVAELSRRVERLKPGPGLDPESGVGPLINAAAVDKVDNQVRDAVTRGAQLLVGGERLTTGSHANGHFYAPTVLANVREDMLIYREETFGPVAAVVPYGDDDDVIAMANDTVYGLAAYVYTNSLQQAMRAFEALRFGIVGINDINPTAAAAPFGGIKESGLGREGGREGIEEYLDVKLGGFAV